jgi:hypothetical protein
MFDDVVASVTCIEWLKLSLEDRRKRRAGIHELFLNNCRHITEENVGSLALMKVVKKVTWDGLENFEDEAEYDSEDGRCRTCDGFPYDYM